MQLEMSILFVILEVSYNRCDNQKNLMIFSGLQEHSVLTGEPLIGKRKSPKSTYSNV